ncbi:MAG: head-tail connector protein [Beijerinckiaceae bacterium]
MGFKRIPGRVWTPEPLPAAALLSAQDLRLQARIDHGDEDTLLAAIIAAAVSHIEMFTQRLLVRRACTLRLDCLPDGRVPLALPGGPVASLTAISVEGVALVLGDFEAIGDSPARLIPAADWPAITDEGYPVAITYQAGYATGNCPAELVAAVRILAAEMYRNREATVDAAVNSLPYGPAMLARPWRIMAG